MTAKPILLGPRERAILLAAPESGGAYAVREVEAASGHRIPKHIHSRESEAWYVLSGELTFSLDDRDFVAPSGSFIYLPVGIAHGFRNSGAGPARFLQVFAPAGLETYFAERANLASEREEGRDYAGLTPSVHATLAAKYGLQFLED